MKRVSFALLLTAFCLNATAQPTLFLVRHAEKATSAGNDPDLSEAGRARADALARILKDANISAIYATEFKRTQQTAAPLARSLGLEVIIVPAATTGAAAFLEQLKTASGNVLVIGHGNTIPDLARAIGLTASIHLGENDYDNLFVIELGERPRLVRLHFP